MKNVTYIRKDGTVTKVTYREFESADEVRALSDAEVLRLANKGEITFAGGKANGEVHKDERKALASDPRMKALMATIRAEQRGE
jgi:hypothetical protein